MHLAQILQFGVVAFRVYDQNAVASQDPSLCDQPNQVTLTRPGRAGDQDPGLTAWYSRRRAVVEGADLDPPPWRTQALCPRQIGPGQQAGNTSPVFCLQDQIGVFSNGRYSVGHSGTDFSHPEQRQVVLGVADRDGVV